MSTDLPVTSDEPRATAGDLARDTDSDLPPVGPNQLTANQRAFLAAYAECGSIRDAAACVGPEGITHRLHYRWMQEPNGQYKRAFECAEQIFGDMLEGHARKLAKEGVLEPVYQGGRLVGEKTKYPQAVLIRLLEGSKPEKYRHNHQVEHTGSITIVERLQAGRKRAAEKQGEPKRDDA